MQRKRSGVFTRSIRMSSPRHLQVTRVSMTMLLSTTTDRDVKGLRSTDFLWLLDGNLTDAFCSQPFHKAGPNSMLEMQHVDVFRSCIFQGLMVIFACRPSTPALLVTSHVTELPHPRAPPWDSLKQWGFV